MIMKIDEEDFTNWMIDNYGYRITELYADTEAKDVAIKYAQSKFNNISLADVIQWVAFDFMDFDTCPVDCKKYLVARKDGKIHWEQWNGIGWAYNHKEIRYWAEIKTPFV